MGITSRIAVSQHPPLLYALSPAGCVCVQTPAPAETAVARKSLGRRRTVVVKRAQAALRQVWLTSRRRGYSSATAATKNRRSLLPSVSVTAFPTLNSATATFRPVLAASVSIDITNTGKLAGADTPQLYLGFPPSAGEPAKQLKGFNKTTVLAPGDKTTVTFPLRHRDLSIWSVTAHEWEVQKGSFVAMVGRSSCDLRANTTFESV